MNYIDYLPGFYEEIPEIAAVGTAFDAENEDLIGTFAMIPRDAVISTAEEERVLQWEKLLGIIPQDRTLVQRRMMILGCLRGAGKLNEAKIKSIVETFSGGDSIVTFSDSTLTVRVLPPSWGEVFLFPDVEKALSPLMPAHINLSVERYYNTWAERVSAYGSWGAIKSGYDAVEDGPGEDITLTNLITNGNFANTAGWLAQGANLSAASNMLTVENTGSVAYGHAYQDLADFTGATGKIINTQFEYMVTNALCTHVYAVNYNGTSAVFVYDKPTPTINTWYKVSVNFAMDSAWNGKTVRQYLRHAYANTANATGAIMQVKNVMTVDLTADLGAGNEMASDDVAEIIASWKDGYFDGAADFVKYPKLADWEEFRNLI